MNSRAHLPRLAGACQAGIRLVLSLSPVAVTSALPIIQSSGLFPYSRPYLALIGAPALRLAEAAPPPDLSVRPPSGAPPHPASASPEPAAASESKSPPSTQPAAISIAPAQAEPAKASKKTSTPPPILPDDTRSKVRPEDFLPFFKFPASDTNSTDNVSPATPPAPGILPPSSVTYRQQ